MAPFPYPDFVLDLFHVLLRNTVGLALVSAYLFPMSRLLRALTLEKARAAHRAARIAAHAAHAAEAPAARKPGCIRDPAGKESRKSRETVCACACLPRRRCGSARAWR